MSQIGFVYLLTNEYMPDVYKVGCTERSPHERAAELSKGSGVPYPFKVLCYIEIDDFQRAEREFHGWLKSYRISENREFFSEAMEYAIRLMWWHPRRLAFCEPLQKDEQGMFAGEEWLFGDAKSFAETKSPWLDSDAPKTGYKPFDSADDIDFAGSGL